MGTYAKPKNLYDVQSNLETKLIDWKASATRWRTVAWVAIFALVLIVVLSAP